MTKPWDLDHMDPDVVREVYESLKTWVSWLEEQGIDVPACWYHGWIVRRPLTLQNWYEEVYERDGPGCGTYVTLLLALAPGRSSRRRSLGIGVVATVMVVGIAVESNHPSAPSATPVQALSAAPSFTLTPTAEPTLVP
jgi:hypothetical protein